MGSSNEGQTTSLKSKWWYRLLRVVLIPLYCVVVLVTWGVIYGEYHRHRVFDLGGSTVTCDDGRTWPLIATGYKYSWEPEEHLDEGEAERARNLCAYGKASGPGDLLGNVRMPDGVLITGVPFRATPSRPGVRFDMSTARPITPSDLPAIKGTDLMARYQRWRSSPRINPETGERIETPIETVQFLELQHYTFNAAFRAEGSWAKTFAYMALAWLAIHFAVVIVRGAVLYVVVGSFLPTSGLRGWLTL
jgi:hypothetical protein